jgi:acylphosphatase
MEEMYCRIHGRVQMVMFRDFTKRFARSLGLVGYVRNCPDGTVEILAQGGRADLERLLAHIRRGSLLSRVDSIDVEWRSPTQKFDGFVIRFD